MNINARLVDTGFRCYNASVKEMNTYNANSAARRDQSNNFQHLPQQAVHQEADRLRQAARRQNPHSPELAQRVKRVKPVVLQATF